MQPTLIFPEERPLNRGPEVVAETDAAEAASAAAAGAAGALGATGVTGAAGAAAGLTVRAWVGFASARGARPGSVTLAASYGFLFLGIISTSLYT